MKQKTNQFLKEVQDEMELFSTALKAYALQELERLDAMEEELNSGDVEMSNELIQLMDPDILNQHLEASKENVDTKLNDIDSSITRELTKDWRNTETRILEEQHQRNRIIVQEVIKSTEKFKREISK